MSLSSDNITTIITAIIAAIVGFFSGITYERRTKKQKLSQKAGAESKLYQAGRDQTINK